MSLKIDFAKTPGTKSQREGGNEEEGRERDLSSVLVGFQSGQGQPELHRQRTAFHGSIEEDFGVFHLLQLNGRLPETNRRRYLLKSYISEQRKRLFRKDTICELVGM